MIRLENIEKSFGNVAVLRDVSLQIASGETLAIIGPSGGGKSTLLRTINFLSPPDSGVLEIDGNGVFRKDAKGGKGVFPAAAELRRLRQTIGMVFQQSHLFTHRTVLENVVEGPVYVLGERVEAAKPRALELLNRLGLEALANRYPNELSGGQQQRVAICRSLAMNPKIMLFDEPTSALDPELVGEVLMTVQEIAKTGMTILIVTHEMSFARHVADRVAFMDGGRLVEIAPPETFFREPRTERAKAFLSAIKDPFTKDDATR